ncbi:MAG: protein TolB [Anaeromyxobacter sp.]
MTRPIALAAALLALAAPAAAQDRPTLVVDSPTFRPVSIAVADFLADGDAPAAELTQVVRGDLALSGFFDVLDPKGFLADPGEGLAAATVKFARWVDVGAEGLVRARVRRDTGDLAAELVLFEVRAGREALRKSVRAPAGEPRLLGHRIADAIVTYYTREPGVFSSRVATVRRNGSTWDLVLLDADGKNPRVLLSEKSILLAPSWRPDGAEILVTSYRGGRPELWTYRLADRGFRRLVAIPNAMGGVYSPDGKQIAFTVTEGANSDVWVSAADGSNARKLTREPALDLSPSWSPDGKRLVFVSDRAGTPQLYLVSAEGGAPRRLTFQGNYNQTPAWSPRGDLIAFTGRDERKVFDVFVVAVDTGRISRVTQDQGRTNEEPSWAPNGRLLVFKTDRGGPPALVVADPKGERQTVIVQGAGELTAPVWGPVTP